MMKRLLTMTIALLSVVGVWADETTIYERKASGGGLSESTSATQVSALWSTKDIYNSTDEATAGGWTLEGTPANVTAAIDGGLKLVGNNNSKSVAYTYSKAISLTSNTSIVRLTADWEYSKPRIGSDATYYSFLSIGDVEIRMSGKTSKVYVYCNNTLITEESINSSNFYGTNDSYVNIEMTINQATKNVSYTLKMYKLSSDTEPTYTFSSSTGITGESITYNLSAGYSKAGGGSATTDIIKNIKVTEEAQDVTLYSYTVNYKVGDNVVKTVTSSLPESSAIPVLTALDGEGDYAGNHYLISADETPSWTILTTVEENTHDVEVRAPYSTTLTVTRNFDGVAEATPYINGQALVETDEKVANWVYTFPYYVQNDEKWYRATLKDEKYGEEGKFTSEAINKTIDYTLDNTVINFWDYSHDSYVNNINYSGGSKNDYQLGETIGSLEAGIYEITVMQDAGYSAKLYKDYTDSNNPGTELLTFDNSNRTRVLTLIETTNNVQIASSGNGRYDYVLVRKLKYTLTSSGENGTVVMKKNDANGETITSGTKVDGGTTVYVSATPDDGYYLALLTKKVGDADAASFVNGTTFTLQDATTITATFTAKTAPTIENLAAETLTYTGAAQNLVTTPTVTGGTISYSTTVDGTYTDEIPTGTNAGDYTVWYKVEGDAQHTSIAATQVENVKINKATISPSVSIEGWTAGESANTPSVEGNTGNGAVTYTYKVKDAADETYSETVPTDAGDYTIKATIAATTNYEGNSATADFTITAATPTYTITGVAEDEHGNKVEADAASATAGTTVTLTITPAANYTLKSISATGVTLSGTGNTRAFTMPAANVTVSATWVETSTIDPKTEIEEEANVGDTSAEITNVNIGENTTEVSISGTIGGQPVTSIAAGTFTAENTDNVQSIDLSNTQVALTMARTDDSSPLKNVPANTLIYLPSTSTMTGDNVIIHDGGGTEATDFTCSNFVMTDAKAYSVPQAFTATAATLNRTFVASQTCTVCLPYAVAAGNIPGKIYRFTSITSNQVTMTEDTDGLDANVPYIFVPNGSDNISQTGGGITVQIASAATVQSDFTFKGIYEHHAFTSEEIAKGVYGFAGNAAVGATPGHFAKATTGAYIEGMRAYLEYTGGSTDPGIEGADVPAGAGARGLEDGDALPDVLNVVLVNADGSTTNIGRLELIDTDDDTPRYNLSGQRVDKSYKGIVIINGRKVIIK